jgi:endonuclease/exonuclease/phosphatase family metal-dependent hydrolase
MKILLSNLGHLRGINGSLTHHLLFAHRHFYCSAIVQENVWRQTTDMIEREKPDVCCFVEIEHTAFHTGHVCAANVMAASYPYFDIENKYAEASRLRTFRMMRGKSNAFMAKRDFPHEKLYFSHGVKRLIYRINLASDLTLFFAHFSLNKKTRAKQLQQVGRLIHETPGEVIFMGDFNILGGFKELAPLLAGNNLVLLNREEHPTFTFHRLKRVLDICLCTQGIATRSQLQVVPQPYSDHAALLLEIKA